MAEATAISWATSTFNPWIGCTKVSPGCDHCYAEVSTPARVHGVAWGPHALRRRTSESNWNLPRRWNRKAGQTGQSWRVFCSSLADVFDNRAPEGAREDLWELIRATPALTWMLLTKRPQNIARMLPQGWGEGWDNVWLGTTVENQDEADRRIPHLLMVPGALRFLSCEPLLGPVLLTHVWMPARDMSPGALWVDALRANAFLGRLPLPEGLALRDRIRGPVGWVIAGGESGPRARPMDPDWARSLRDQCAAAGVPFHFKQWGGTTAKAGGHLLDGIEHLAIPGGQA
jgi:protein gp37